MQCDETLGHARTLWESVHEQTISCDGGRCRFWRVWHGVGPSGSIPHSFDTLFATWRSADQGVQDYARAE